MNIGNGHYATTFLVISNDKKAATVIKLFHKNYDAMSSREQSTFANETNMMKQCNHDNLVQIISYKKNASVSNAKYLFNSAVQ